jgi:hypothetical protein
LPLRFKRFSVLEKRNRRKVKSEINVISRRRLNSDVFAKTAKRLFSNIPPKCQKITSQDELMNRPRLELNNTNSGTDRLFA